VLAEDILLNSYAEMRAMLTVIPEYRDQFEQNPAPRSGWDIWQPNLVLRQHLAVAADNALPKSNKYRRWYDFGRLLGEWIRQSWQGEGGNLDIPALRQVIRLLPDAYLGRIAVLKQFLQLGVHSPADISGLGQILGKVLGLDAAEPSEDTDRARVSKTDVVSDNLVKHFISVPPLSRALDLLARTVMADLGTLANLRENPSYDSRNDRDTWIYRECVMGTPYDQIIDELNGNTSDWTPIATPNGIKGAANRYADKNGLPHPQIRQPGRPKKTEHDR